MTNDREERIRKRAHEIWEQEGQPAGRHDEHWDKATREVDGSMPMEAMPDAPSDPTAPAPTKGRKRAASEAPAPKARAPRSSAKAEGATAPTRSRRASKGNSAEQ